MKNITDYRKQSILNFKMRYEEGIMTRAEWIKIKLSQEWYAKEETKSKIQYSRAKFNKMNRKEQEEYERKCAEMVPCWVLQKGRESFEITKTEFEYFNQLMLEQDIKTEKHHLQYKMDAGIATNDEIEQAEQKELDFFKKYYS